MERWPLLRFVAAALCLAGAGCLGAQTASDGRNFRQALLDVYTDQIMTNLINAYERRPMVQLKYADLSVTDTQSLTATLGYEADPTKMQTFAQATGAALMSTRQTINRLLFGASAEADHIMICNADPISGQPDIFDYYSAFANDPSMFGASLGKPPDCEVHLQRKCGDTWYYVPKPAAGVFLQLTMKTTFMRGTQTPPPIFWATKVTATPSVPGSSTDFNLTFDPPVPYDPDLRAYVLADVNACHQLRFNVIRLTNPVPGPRPIGNWATGAAARSAESLTSPLNNAPGKFYAPHMPNMGYVPPPEMRYLETLVENYRLQLKSQH